MLLSDSVSPLAAKFPPVNNPGCKHRRVSKSQPQLPMGTPDYLNHCPGKAPCRRRAQPCVPVSPGLSLCHRYSPSLSHVTLMYFSELWSRLSPPVFPRLSRSYGNDASLCVLAAKRSSWQRLTSPSSSRLCRRRTWNWPRSWAGAGTRSPVTTTR